MTIITKDGYTFTEQPDGTFGDGYITWANYGACIADLATYEIEWECCQMIKRFCLVDADRDEALCISVKYADSGNIIGYNADDFNRRIDFDNCLEVLEYAICEGNYKVGDTLEFSRIVDDEKTEFWWTDDIGVDSPPTVEHFVYRVTSIKTI